MGRRGHGVHISSDYLPWQRMAPEKGGPRISRCCHLAPKPKTSDIPSRYYLLHLCWDVFDLYLVGDSGYLGGLPGPALHTEASRHAKISCHDRYSFG